jgi:hypothetical protein
VITSVLAAVFVVTVGVVDVVVLDVCEVEVWPDVLGAHVVVGVSLCDGPEIVTVVVPEAPTVVVAAGAVVV